MKKNIFILMVLFIAITFSGCWWSDQENLPLPASPNTDSPHPAATTNIANEDGDEDSTIESDDTPSIGGISLGLALSEVTEKLGEDYAQSSETDDAKIIGEDLIVLSYDKGIKVYIGETSGQVIRIETQDAKYPTDEGVKVGDEAQSVFEKYLPHEKVKSRHSDEVLIGWYYVGDKIVIFDFNKDDDTLVNSDVKESSQVEEIILARWEHFN